MTNHAVVQSLVKENNKLKERIAILEKWNRELEMDKDRLSSRVADAQLGLELIDLLKRATSS